MKWHRCSVLSVSVIFIASVLSGAQAPLPQPDKDGWIKLFRGDNPQDWYSALNGPKAPAQSKTAFPNAVFSLIGKDTLKSSGSPTGQVYFNRSFSHYHIRYQMHFPGKEGNCGMLLHVQENDAPMNGFPVSIESQGDPAQGMGEAWPIGNVWVTIRARPVNGRMTYDPAVPETVYGGKDWNSRVIAGKDGWAKPAYAPLAALAGGWVTQESDVHGWDSVADIVSDTVRIKYRQPVISPGGTPGNVTKKLTGGLLGWQSEGTEVWYRNIEIKLYPDDPLYQTTYVRQTRDSRIAPKDPARMVFDARNGSLDIPGVRSGAPDLFDARGRIRSGVLFESIR